MHTGEVATKFQPQLKDFGKWLFKVSANAGATVLEFVASIIIAAVFMSHAESIRSLFVTLINRLYHHQGEELISQSTATIRSVAQGVIGVALIQSLLAAPAVIWVGIPAAGIVVFAILIVAIIQLPTVIVTVPTVLYAYSIADHVSASIFAVYLLAVGFSDHILKPLLLGRGVDVPMLVILLGAIGGMLLSGIIGLFTGAVMLALGYRIFTRWLREPLN